ncbi:MAG: mechanosensitive ion channel family protein [Candidatus Thermoplasmatota archaeon]|jgi:small-conductance mechanosensitive channel|nr:mechanosensitive ion channel family protein [Candidatus Thermoplasmatota archaeon]
MEPWAGYLGKAILYVSLLSLLIPFSPAVSSRSAEVRHFPDMLALYESYNTTTRTFSVLSPGDMIEVTDTVSTSWYNERTGMSELYFRSTGTSVNGPKLTFIGPYISDRIERGMKVNVTAVVLLVDEGNGPEHLLSASSESVNIIKEVEREEEPETIDVFGVQIPLSEIPKEYRTNLVRFIIVFLLWSIGTAIIWGLFRLSMRIAAKTKTELDKKIIRIVRIPVLVVMLLYGLIVSLRQLNPPDNLMMVLDRVYRSGLIIVAAFVISRIFKEVVIVYLRILSAKTETKADDVLVPVAGKLISVVIWVTAGILLLDSLGVDITVFVAGLGIAGLVIAFAAQDTLSNFFSGLMIMLDRPFKEGDWIMLDEKVYQVKDIGLRSTRLHHTFTNQLLTIPNNRISDYMFSNLSEPDQLGRVSVEVGVSYSVPPRKVGQVLLDVVGSHKDIFNDTEHQSFYRLKTFADSSINYMVTFWVKDHNEQWRIASEVREAIYDRFASEGIEIPFPQRVVHIKQAPAEVQRTGRGTVAKDPARMSNLSP